MFWYMQLLSWEGELMASSALVSYMYMHAWEILDEVIRFNLVVIHKIMKVLSVDNLITRNLSCRRFD